MVQDARDHVMLLSERLYRLLLLTYPKAHRAEYGPLMQQLFHDLCQDAYRQRGYTGFISFWGRILKDTLNNVIVERSYVLNQGGQMMTERQHRVSVTLAGLPLGLGLLLYLMNPIFMGQMFMPSPAQPVGWLMALAIVILTVSAYGVQRKLLMKLYAPAASGQALPDQTAQRRWRVFVGPALLLVLPALLLVLFGPALMQILILGG